MSDKEQHVRWVVSQANQRGYREFAGVIEGVLSKSGVEEAYKYIQINAEVQKMLFLDRGNGDMSA